MQPYIVGEEYAVKIWDWVQNRGGIKVWHSADLSDPGWGTTSPARTAEGIEVKKPHWKADPTPRLITDAAEIVVSHDKEVKRIPISLRMGSQGLKVKLTDTSTRKVTKAVEDVGEGGFYRFDYDKQEAVIFKQTGTTPLATWIAQKGGCDVKKEETV